MRFHMGISFRLKTLKKFLIPILIGIASYFGFSLFNIDIVHAYDNTNTGYYIDYMDYDFSYYTFGDYSFQDVWNLLTTESEYYDIYIQAYYDSTNDNFSLIPYFIPKNINTNVYSLARGSNINNNFTSYGYSNIPTGVFSYYSPIGSSFDSTKYDKIYNCLYNNTGCNDYNYFSIPTSSTINLFNITSDTTINNNDDYFFLVPYSLQFGDYFPLYNNSGITFTYIFSSVSNSSTSFAKKLYINSTLIDNWDSIPMYCDIYDCSNWGTGGGGDTPLFNVVSPDFKYFYGYTTPQDLSSTFIGVNYNVNDLVDYNANYDRLMTSYFGRIDHGTYYSYESLTCTRDITYFDDYDNNLFSYLLNNFSCNGNLSNYDRIYITYGLRHYDDSKDSYIYNLNINSNINYKYTDYKGLIYDNFNLSSEFIMLLSTNDSYNPVNVKFTSDNSYMSFQLVSNKDSNIITRTNGSFGYYCAFGNSGDVLNPYCSADFGNPIYQSNLMIFDDAAYSGGNSLTNLDIFLQDDSIIISVAYNGADFIYYDDTYNIVDNTISLTYDKLPHDSGYDSIMTIIKDINDYFNDLQADLGKIHNIVQDIYDDIPLGYRSAILIFYCIGLIYLLYCEIKR